MSERELKLMYVVRGYHVYKDMWDLYLGDDFTTKFERHYRHNKYAIAVLPVDAKSKTVVARTFAEGDIQGMLPVHSP